METNDTGSFSDFADTCDRIRSTSSKLKKIEYLSQYFSTLDSKDLKISATFLSGRIFAPGETESEVNVGYSTLWRILGELLGLSDRELGSYYSKRGDLGWAVEDALQVARFQRPQSTLFEIPNETPSLQMVYDNFRELSNTVGKESSAKKFQILKRLFLSVRNPNEAKYLVKLLGGEMRIGLVEGLVEESIAKAFDYSLAEVRSANLVSGNIGLVAVLARERRLFDAKLLPMRPTNFMLAETAETAEDLCSRFDSMPVFSEYKYDGIRAQVHLKEGQVSIFSRNLANVTKFFPEIEASFRQSSEKIVITDGEILAYKDGKPYSFQLLQRRLRKKQITEKDVPVRYFAFDLLYYDGTSIIGRPLRERVQKLRSIDFGKAVSFSEQRPVTSVDDVSKMFLESKSLGFEGLVVKQMDSVYSPGRRGGSWVKLKKELDTLDVVIVAAEYGHGKRAGVISDYTFAVRDGNDLKTVGKAYSGLTDEEIDEMTEALKSITVEDFGYRRTVIPKIVLEVAFDAIQKSDRHNSGFALRFPRIKSIRADKSVADIDTIERVKNIYEKQSVKV